MKRISIVVAVTLFGVGSVLATPEGSALMKNTGKALATVLAATAKGDKPYAQADIDAALNVLADTAAKMPTLYPDSVKTAAPSGDYGPSPKVFDDKAGYAKAVADFAAAVTAAKASVKDLDSLKAAMPTITKNCSGCHETYRVKI